MVIIIMKFPGVLYRGRILGGILWVFFSEIIIFGNFHYYFIGSNNREYPCVFIRGLMGRFSWVILLKVIIIGEFPCVFYKRLTEYFHSYIIGS